MVSTQGYTSQLSMNICKVITNRYFGGTPFWIKPTCTKHVCLSTPVNFTWMRVSRVHFPLRSLISFSWKATAVAVQISWNKTGAWIQLRTNVPFLKNMPFDGANVTRDSSNGSSEIRLTGVSAHEGSAWQGPKNPWLPNLAWTVKMTVSYYPNNQWSLCVYLYA